MAPVPGKDRIKKHREKLKEQPEKREAYLKKERERDKIRRQQAKEKLENNQRLKDKNRINVRNRVKAYRERKKQVKSSTESKVTSPIGSYKCNQTFGKAVKKVLRVLPQSPSKKTAIIKKVVSELIGPENLTWSSPTARNRSSTLSEEEKLKIKEFYCRDDISRQAPGRKDVVTVWEKDGKKKFQKRHLILTVGEVYEEFKKVHPEITVGKSVFYTLRPCFVLLSSCTPHNVCVSEYHYNFISLLESLSKAIPSIPSNHNELLKKLSCNTLNENCMFGLCEECHVNLNKIIPEDFDLSKTIVWKQWEKDQKHRPCLSEHSESCESALAALATKLPYFKKHCYVKKSQSDYFQKKKESLAVGECVLQMDFAENYSLVSQDEIQSAHWAHSQITICTFCVWLPKDKIMSYAIVSNDLSHTKYSVWTFLRTIITDIKAVCPEVNTVFIFSDNCAGQFKSKYNLSNLCFFEEDFGLTVEWNCFASSHGKGAMDGIGGALKRAVWSAVRSRKVIINNATDFFNYTQEIFVNVKVLWVDASTVESNIAFLDERWKTVAPIPQIQSCHHFQPYDTSDLLISKTVNSLMTRIPVFISEEKDSAPKLHAKKRLKYSEVYSSSDNSDNELLHLENDDDGANLLTSKIERSEVKSGLFVLIEVPSDKKKPAASKSALTQYRYLGICQSGIDEEGDVNVMFLKCVGNSKTVFKLDEHDVCYVNFSQILFKVTTPELKMQGNRLYYEFRYKLNVAEKDV